MESCKIYLCKADCSILGNISGLKLETCSLKKHAIEQWEITFDVERYTNNNLCELKQSDFYDSIDTMMRLYLDGKEQIYFIIDSEPIIKGEGLQEIKTVTAHSIECELTTLYLKNFKINCGTKDSQEYLVTDSNGNFNNVIPYTNLVYKYVSLINYDNPQLSLLHLVLRNTGWTVEENINKDICDITKSFDISDTNIYDFLINIVSPSASVIFQFDKKHKKVGLVKADDFGEDTGIFVTMRNLMNSFEITSSSNDDLITKLIPTGANDLAIEQVNFGNSYITNLEYFMNTLNEYGDFKYVSKELHDKYILWKNYREIDKVTFNGKECTRREQYIELTKLYNKTILDINDLKNRVPNDGAVTDYKTFKLDELKLHLNAYNKALASLITIYKNEYGVGEMGDAPNYTQTPSSATNIKDTPYWHDFYAYKESIIPQIEEALKMYCQTGPTGNLIVDTNGHFIEMEFGNPAYYADPSIVKEIDAYKYEWSLYGLDELEAKKKAWCEVANLLFNECFILSGTVTVPTTYRTPDDNGWNSLSPVQKKEFTSKSAYIDKLNQYLDYMSFDLRNNSLTKTKCKGIIRQCEDAIMSRKNEIASLETLQNSYQTQRIKLANSVSIENFKVNNTLLFTEKDLNVINSMIREQDYNNSNILTTNLDDIVTTIDAQEELYQAASEELYKLSQPQYSFSTDMDNLYALEEFQCYHDDFEVGNFIRAGFEIHEELFDNEFIKLRLMSITYNPLNMSSQDISVEFSTMTKELDGVSDLAYLLGENNSYSSGNSSSSSSSGGTYGNNDANVQMSNNMLNALLSTELFGTTVTDVILDSVKANKGNFNTLLSHSGIFDSLEAGHIKVSGDCLFDHIKSSNYVKDKSGSMLDLLNGKFDFAGGKLTWDGTNLSVDGNGKFTGDIIANSLKLGQNVKIDNTNISGLSKVATTGDFNDLSNTSNILMTDDISIESNTDLNGITTKTITVGEHVYTTKESDNYILTNVGIGTNSEEHSKSYFKVSKEGMLEANNALIYGTVYATNGRFSGEVNANSGSFTGDIIANTLTANQSGTIAGWTFDENGFYKGENDFASKEGMYLGNNGLSIKDYFSVDTNGFIFKDKNYVVNDYNTSSIETNSIKIDKNIGISENDYILICFNSSKEVIIGDFNIGFSYENGIGYYEISNSECNIYTHSDLSSLWNDKNNSLINRYMYRLISTYGAKYVALYPISKFTCFDFNNTDYYNLNIVYTNFSTIDFIGVVINYNNIINKFFVNKFNTKKNGMIIDSEAKKISIDDIDITSSSIIGRNNYSIQFGGNLNSEPGNCYPGTTIIVPDNYDTISTTIIDFDGIRSANNDIPTYDFYFSRFYGIKSPTTYSDKVSGKSLYINSDGLIGLSSSSKRFKNSISTTLSKVSDPHGLYDIDIVQYKYNNDYFSSPNDEGIGKYFIGFIAENVAEKFKVGATFDKEGLPDGWDIRYMFPAALKLIQEQYYSIQELQKNDQDKDREIKNLQKEIETMKQQFQEIKSFNMNQ